MINYWFKTQICKLLLRGIIISMICLLLFVFVGSYSSCNSSNLDNEPIVIADSSFIKGQFKVRIMPLSKAFTRTSVNTSIFRLNAIVSDANYQFVAYYDDKGYITFAKRSVISDEWEIIKTKIQGDCARAEEGGYYADAHKVISIGLDGDGYLHMCNDMHANQLKYRKSLKPYTCEFGETETMINEDEENLMTYPEFHRLSNGNLLFVCRGVLGVVQNEYNIKTKRWQRRGTRQIIDNEESFCAYWQICLDENDNIYILVVA